MPLTVYADVLLTVNLYIDFFLLWCVRRFLNLQVKNARLVLGAAVAALCALLSLLELSAPLSIIAGAAVAVLVALSSFAPTQPKMLLKAALCFWMFSFLLAGFFLFLARFFAPKNIAVLGSVVYIDLSPLLLFVFTCAAYLVFWLFYRLFKYEGSNARFCTLVIRHGENTAELSAKADTGNALREPFSNLPVVICERDAISAVMPRGVDRALEHESVSAVRLVPFESLGGAGLLPAFKPSEVREKKTGKKLSCYIAVSERKLSAGQFSAIYNPDLLEELGK